MANCYSNLLRLFLFIEEKIYNVLNQKRSVDIVWRRDIFTELLQFSIFSLVSFTSMQSTLAFCCSTSSVGWLTAFSVDVVVVVVVFRMFSFVCFDSSSSSEHS